MNWAQELCPAVVLQWHVFIWVLWNTCGRRFAVSGPSAQHQAVGFFTTMHRAVVVKNVLARKQVCVLNHPPYSTDLTTCDHFLLPKLKLRIKGRIFNPLNSELNPICHLVTLLAHPIFHVSRIRVKDVRNQRSCDIDSSGHTTRKRSEVVPVFARSCHSLHWCRRDVLWIKYG
jgi:hypothetical protein